MFFFFFKQKTAYELRISDWSSDVCSSDLKSSQRFQHQCIALSRARCDGGFDHGIFARYLIGEDRHFEPPLHRANDVEIGQAGLHHHARSEEHTSELQSLMRISYAVFGLKKKKQGILDRLIRTDVTGKQDTTKST